MKIKKAIILAAVGGLMMSFFSGCVEPVNEAIGEHTDLSGGIVSDIIADAITHDVMNDVDDYEDGTTTKKQKIEIYSAADNSLLYTITDNSTIVTYMRNVIGAIASLKYLATIPGDAEAMSIYVLRQEDLDSGLPVDERPLLESLRSTLYKNDNGYYTAVQLDEKIWYVFLPDTTGEYLIKLAEGEIEPDVIDTTNNNALHGYGRMNEDIDYEGVASVSDNQKIEVLSLEDNSVILSITDIEDIVEFLQNQHIAWKRIDSIPADAQKIRAIVRYAEQRNTADKQLTEQYRDTLYVNPGGYYIETKIADSGLTPSLDELGTKCFEIPDDVGEYLINLR